MNTRYLVNGAEHDRVLQAGDAFVAHVGDAHMALPQVVGRVLVVEHIGSP